MSSFNLKWIINKVDEVERETDRQTRDWKNPEPMTIHKKLKTEAGTIEVKVFFRPAKKRGKK